MRHCFLAAAILAIVEGLLLGGCGGPQPFVREGSAESVEIAYSGDPGSALPLARRHCAQFSRVPRLVNSGADSAVFDCIRGQ
jgi:hypothetical protein